MNVGNLGAVTRPVKSRTYRSPKREEQARRTKHAILAAARQLLVEHGYSRTTVASIAEAAGVAVDTVYSSVGAKPVLFRLLLETAISGTDEAVRAEQRDYVLRIRAAERAKDKLELYAAALRLISERMAPLHLILRDAAPHAPELAELRDEIGRRRARNMRLFAEDLLATGDLRPGLELQEVADVIWSTSSAEFFSLLVNERGWSSAKFENWLAATWCRQFLAVG